MTISIRDASPDDAESFAVLLAEMGYPTTHETAATHIERFAGDPSSRLQAAVIATGDVVGLIATHAVPRLDDAPIPAA